MLSSPYLFLTLRGGGGEPEGIDLDGVAVAPCGSYVCIVDRHTQDLLLVF